MSHKKPVEVHRRNGNPSKLTLPTPVAYQAPVTIQAATKTPEEIIEHVVSDGAVWLGQTDAFALRLMKDLLAERQDIQDRLAADDGTCRRSDLRHINDQIMKLSVELGLTPISRSRLGLSEVKAESALDKLRAARQVG